MPPRGWKKSIDPKILEQRKHYRQAYDRWKSMMSRCYDPRHHKYPDYGARGIAVEQRWHDFKSFYADVGDAPEGRPTLDRTNNDENYGPGNFRWATWSEQNLNKRPYRPRKETTRRTRDEIERGVPVSEVRKLREEYGVVGRLRTLPDYPGLRRT